MTVVTFEQARARQWDVVVAGSSFAASFFVHALPPDLRVLIVEKGSLVPHAEQVARGWPQRDRYRQRNTSGREKIWLSFTTFGGNSNYWWADTPRFHPDDFALRSRFGVGEDWPLGYDDLEPFWQRAERIMEIAGGGSDHILPRSAPFPSPPHRLSRADEALAAQSDLWVPLPTARSNGGSRATCCANGACSICPIDAKFTVQTGRDRLAHPGAHLLLETEVRAVETAAGRAAGVLLRHRGGAQALVPAEIVGLGANAIHNAAILMRSGLGGPSVGRYLHEQATREVTLDVATIRNFFGGTSNTLHGYHFYHGADRRDAGAVLIETVNAPAPIRPEPGRWANRMRLLLVTEDLPQPQNRVLIDEDEPLIEWSGHHAYAHRGLDRAVAGLPDLIPDEIERMEVSEILPSEAHIQGTHRMGTDPARSVVDDRQRVHGTPGLFALGAGSFPACSPANPSLTLSALSLRSGEAAG